MSSDAPKPTPSTDLQSRIRAVTKLLPVHHLPRRERARLGHCVVRAGGRPKKIEVPVVDADGYNTAIDEQRQVWIQADPVVRTQEDGSDPVLRLREVEKGLAAETASLLWERRRAERDGGDAAQVSTRRIEALHKLSLAVLGRVRFFESEIAPEKVERIANLWVEMIREAAEPLDQDIAGPFVAKVETAMAEWLAGKRSA